jgi:hypothetical protein
MGTFMLALIVTSQSYGELAHSLPLLLKLQADSRVATDLMACQKICIEECVAEYLIFVGDYLNIPEMIKYAQDIKFQLTHKYNWVSAIDFESAQNLDVVCQGFSYDFI